MKAIVVANWKMNPQTMREAKRLFAATKKVLERQKSVTCIVAPPTIFLRELRALSRGKKILFAAQNAHFEKEGAFTGETPMSALKEAHISHVIVGHAERRAAGETNDDTQKKVASALSLGLTPILCVGERSRSAIADHFQFIAEQLKAGCAAVPAQRINKIMIAYEPVWAIGASSAMSAREMHEMAIFIRKTLFASHGEAAHSVTILYGGSIDETNARDMVVNGDVRGLLVGRASADPQKIVALIQSL